MSWKAEIEELHRRRQLAEACGGPEAVAGHHKSGKLTVRERIARLLDAGSFREVGKLAGTGTYKDDRLVAFEPAPYRREIENAPDPAAREREIEEELRQLASPFRTAEAFAIEDVIDPRETRPYLCQFIEAAQSRLKTQPGPKFKGGVRP